MTLQSEQDYLKLIDRHFPGKLDNELDSVELARGDDCAVLAFKGSCCVSSDLFLDTVHFRRSYFSPYDLGHKALAVNLSDIAAMGGVPRFFTLDLMVSDDCDEPFFEDFFSGMANLAARHDLILAGGDLSRSPLLGASIHIMGEAGPTGRLLARGNARPGDLLVTVGALGLARVGLHMLEVKGSAAGSEFPEAVASHLRPKPQVQAGLALAASDAVLGMMDVSDGLARDLPRFLEASGGLGARLAVTQGTLHPEVVRFAEKNDLKAEMVAVSGGEDYALLAAIDPDHLRTVQARVPGVEVVGAVTEQPGIWLDDTHLEDIGFDHFGG